MAQPVRLTWLGLARDHPPMGLSITFSRCRMLKSVSRLVSRRFSSAVSPIVLVLFAAGSFTGAVGALSGCKRKQAPGPASNAAPAEAPAELPLPAPPPLPGDLQGLPELDFSASETTAARVELGKTLFFDKRLSGDGSASCETCHVHELGWTDGTVASKKVNGSLNTRNSPTLYNVGYQPYWYWDGRATDMTKQVLAAWKGHMSGEPEQAAATLNALPWYKRRFERAFGTEATPETIGQALAAFVRTLRSGDSAWDRFEAGDAEAVSEEAKKGWLVFRDKARCTLCHVPPLFTDLSFHNIGIGLTDAGEMTDPGRYKVTQKEADRGAFKTPSLRSVTKTGPYFHDGSAATLEDAVRYMVAGGLIPVGGSNTTPGKSAGQATGKKPRKGPGAKPRNKWLDPRLRPAKLSPDEFSQLMAFISALESTESFEPPQIP